MSYKQTKMLSKYDQIIVIDIETFFSTTYSLKSKQYNTSEYVRDPQFKIQCMGIKIGEEQVGYFSGNAVEEVLRSVDWTRSALLAHNTSFDGFILSHYFDIVPVYYLDTLSMARAIHANNIRARLGDVAQFYGIGNKIPDVLDKTKGVRDLSSDLLSQLSKYCAVDTELCYQIFQLMLPEFQQSELDLIDLTVRMFCDPVLKVDVQRAKDELARELNSRKYIILSSGVEPEILRSNQKVVLELAKRGVQAPMKVSKVTGKDAPALAKGDLEFQALLTHPDEEVRKLVSARLAIKSSINETRAIRFIRAGESGNLPVLLNYHGAHTSRWSAGNKMNLQNLVRGGELRKCIIAPPGFQIVSCDSAQIEARVLAWFADHQALLDLFREGRDVYKTQAAMIYGVPEESVTPEQRFVGKVATLGLGYGMGADKFEYTLAAGLMGPPVKIENEGCRLIVNRWRRINLPIPQLWAIMNAALTDMLTNFPGERKGVTWNKEGIALFNGIKLRYPHLTGDYDDVNAMYKNIRYYSLAEAVKARIGAENKPKSIYGGLIVENIVQALARIIVADQMLEIAKKYRVVTMTHDEIVCLVKQEEVREAEVFMTETMRTPPSWAADLPLNAAVESGVTYG